MSLINIASKQVREENTRKKFDFPSFLNFYQIDYNHAESNSIRRKKKMIHFLINIFKSLKNALTSPQKLHNNIVPMP